MEVSQISLTISLTINAAVALYFLYRSLVTSSFYFVKCLKRSKSWSEFHEDNSWVFPKLLTEQTLTMVLLTFALTVLVATEVLQYPFVHSKPDQLLTITMAMSIGRYLYKMVQDFLVMEKGTIYLVGMMHHAVAVIIYVAILQQGQLYILGLIGVFMEADVIWYDLSNIAKRQGVERTSKTYLITSGCGLCFGLLLRVFLPCILLVVSLKSQSLSSLSPLSISIFCLSLVFFSVLSIFMLQGSIVSLRKTISLRRASSIRMILDGPYRSVLVKPEDILNHPPVSGSKLPVIHNAVVAHEPEMRVTCFRNSLKLPHLPPCANANVNPVVNNNTSKSDKNSKNQQLETVAASPVTCPIKAMKIPVNILLATTTPIKSNNQDSVTIKMS